MGFVAEWGALVAEFCGHGPFVLVGGSLVLRGSLVLSVLVGFPSALIVPAFRAQSADTSAVPLMV